MSLDSSKISIVSAKKVDPKKLIEVGDRLPTTPPPMASPRCPLCCIGYGSILSSLTTLLFTSFLTAIAIRGEGRVRYTLNGAARQALWMALPGSLVGATLHFFLAEAMWSGRRGSWGAAWAKAIAVNSVLWAAVVGGGTFVWRRLLPTTAAGRRLYHRYPIPAEGLELRMLRGGRGGRALLAGMGWSYWACGIGFGQLGLATVVVFCVATDRPFLMMAPHGGYARYCMPPWRREQFALMANTPSNSS
ncbi:unnamed protein product [Phytomonas sp. EM1]|nr:unnamed protein product [Phytomonas sp. EM1]|eukprot:CCW62107.1 unnamed protein product [Phytomonas sp. isolate EM1]